MFMKFHVSVYYTLSPGQQLSRLVNWWVGVLGSKEPSLQVMHERRAPSCDQQCPAAEIVVAGGESGVEPVENSFGNRNWRCGPCGP